VALINDDCELCLKGAVGTRESKRPTPEQFTKFLPYFLQQYPDEKCPKAGRAQFLPAINFNTEDASIGREYFSNHTPDRIPRKKLTS
jgi:hypothetical protein